MNKAEKAVRPVLASVQAGHDRKVALVALGDNEHKHFEFNGAVARFIPAYILIAWGETHSVHFSVVRDGKEFDAAILQRDRSNLRLIGFGKLDLDLEEGDASVRCAGLWADHFDERDKFIMHGAPNFYPRLAAHMSTPVGAKHILRVDANRLGRAA